MAYHRTDIDSGPSVPAQKAVTVPRIVGGKDREAKNRPLKHPIMGKPPIAGRDTESHLGEIVRIESATLTKGIS